MSLPESEADLRAIIRDELRKAGVNAPEAIDPNAAKRFSISDGMTPPNTTVHYRGGPRWQPTGGSCGECLTGYPKRIQPPTADEIMAMLNAGQAIPPADEHAKTCAGMVHAVFGGYVSGGEKFVEVCEKCNARSERLFVNGKANNRA